MADFGIEFMQVAVAHALAVASPGPDFALVLRQSVAHGRRTAMWTSLGIGTAILVHVAYALLGLGLLVRGSETWFNVVKYAGAGYLAWIGFQALRARPAPEVVAAEPVPAASRLAKSRAFLCSTRRRRSSSCRCTHSS